MIKARDFKLELTITAYDEGRSSASLIKSTSMEVEGSSVMSADKVRRIVMDLCSLLTECVSDSEIEEIVNKG